MIHVKTNPFPCSIEYEFQDRVTSSLRDALPEMSESLLEIITACLLTTKPSSAYLKRHQNSVKSLLKHTLPPMPRGLLEMITAYVCHELANLPQRIDISGERLLNSVSCGWTSGNRQELILSQVFPNRSTTVTRVTTSGMTGLNITTFRGPRAPQDTVFSIAREPRGIFHFADGTNDNAFAYGQLYEERGKSLIPFDTLPDTHRRGFPEVIQVYNPHSEEMWRLNGHYGLMTYTAPNTGKPGALAQADRRAVQRKTYSVREMWYPSDPYVRSSLLTTALTAERMVLVTEERIELFATDRVEGSRGCKMIKSMLPVALGKRYSDKLRPTYEPFTAATCTPDHTLFFAATKREAINIFSIENDRIHLRGISSFLEHIYTMAANSAAVAMTMAPQGRHYLWDIETRETISSIQEDFACFHAACWLTESNILFARGKRFNPNRYSLVAYDFRTPHSQKSPALKLVL